MPAPSRKRATLLLASASACSTSAGVRECSKSRSSFISALDSPQVAQGGGSSTLTSGTSLCPEQSFSPAEAAEKLNRHVQRKERAKTAKLHLVTAQSSTAGMLR